MQKYERRCANCGLIFQANRSDKIYCSKQCVKSRLPKRQKQRNVTSRRCQICNNIFRGHEAQRYCNECADGASNGNNFGNCVDAQAVGAVGELIVASELIKRGFYVFRSLAASGPCDLVCLTRSVTYRIEVTKGTSCGGHVSYGPKGDSYCYDFLAVPLENGDIFWYDEHDETCSGPHVS